MDRVLLARKRRAKCNNPIVVPDEVSCWFVVGSVGLQFCLCRQLYIRMYFKWKYSADSCRLKCSVNAVRYCCFDRNELTDYLMLL